MTRRPVRTHLYLHLSLADLATHTAPAPTVREVEKLSPATLDRHDRHDPPPWMREQVILRDRHCVFPWCGRDARLTDLDHTVPYAPPDEGGPPGQTNPHNLAPLCRRHHRARTLTGWTYHHAHDGTHTWNSPHARTFTVGPDGTYASTTADTHADRAATYTLAT